MDNITEILKALAEPTRYRIITQLLSRDYCVGALAKRLCLSEAAVSQHLQLLRRAGAVKGEKRGYFTHYAVDRELIKAAARELTDLASRPAYCGCNCHESYVEHGRYGIDIKE